jgi:CubicO group peptidase (beta-lactamase class C family)
VVRGACVTVELKASPDNDFEIGSISKAVTGLLYADAVAAGVLEPGTRLGTLLDVGTGDVAGIHLGDLATHRSGLPRLPRGMNPARRTWELWRRGSNPYGDSVAALLEQARATSLSRPRFRYSNLGFELLGHAIASAHGTTYQDLLATRITGPLGMRETYAPVEALDLREQALVGRSRSGRIRAPWTGEALAPAGGIRASPRDVTKLILGLLEGTAPGVSAMDPVATMAGPARIGAAWMVVPRKQGTLTWHNGRTGGFGSWIGLDRARHTGAVVLAATSRSVDGIGMELLDRVSGASPTSLVK